MRGIWTGAATAALLIWTALAGPATGQDRHAGYYYPEPGSSEIFKARAETLPQADRAMRIGFVTGITHQQVNRPYPPPVAIFAKGTEAEKLIIVALDDGRLDTLYRARAVFANLTAGARLLPAFAQMGMEDVFTFFDLAKMLGFQQITVSDGRAFAHQVIIE